MIVRWAYRLLLWLGFPLIWLYLLKRSKKQPAYRQFWGERLGYYAAGIDKKDLQDNTQRPIWLHAVSVGEMRACVPIIQAIRIAAPHRPVLLTCMTPTGRETAQALFGGFASIVYLPYDYPAAIRRFLQHFRPQCGVVMETEIWPNLLHESAAAQVPLVLANARLSESSFRGYQRISALIAPAMAKWSLVLAQAPADAERLAALGARAPKVMGSVKFDHSNDAAIVARGQAWRAALLQQSNRPLVLLASSREGEEAAFLAQWQAEYAQTAAPLLIIVPRHPQRFDAVADLIRSHGLALQRRSQWQDAVAADVILGDSMGEMAAWFAASDVCIMGGSLLPFGSQNFIEACALGCPVLLGPHTFNFAAATAAALAEGAAWQGQTLGEILDKTQQLLLDDAERQAMSAAGVEFANAHRGATARLVHELTTYL